MNEADVKTRILILEDDLDLALQWRTAFEQADVEVVLTSSRVEAQRVCEQEQFDALIIDIFLRGFDGSLVGDGGLTLINHLRLPPLAETTAWTVTAPIIAVTGSGNIMGFDAIEYAIDLGATIGLRKPIASEQLVSELLALLP